LFRSVLKLPGNQSCDRGFRAVVVGGLVTSAGPAVLDAVAVFPAEVGIEQRWGAGIVGGGDDPGFLGGCPVVWCDKFPWLLGVFRAQVQQPADSHRGM